MMETNPFSRSGPTRCRSGTPSGCGRNGALGRIDEDTMAGGGLHLFTRDPSSYLLGLYGSYHAWNSVDIWRAAAEFQLYVRQFSLDGLAGFESVNVPTTAGSPVVGTSDNLAFGQIDLAYYPIDDLKLTIGHHYEDATSLGSVGVEYLRQRFADFSVRQERFRRRAVQPRNGRPQDVFRQRARQIAPSSATAPRIPRITRRSFPRSRPAQTSARSTPRSASCLPRMANASVRPALSKPAIRQASLTAATCASTPTVRPRGRLQREVRPTDDRQSRDCARGMPNSATCRSRRSRTRRRRTRSRSRPSAARTTWRRPRSTAARSPKDRIGR